MLACTLYIIHQNRESNFSSIPQSFYLFPHLWKYHDFGRKYHHLGIWMR